MNTDEAKNELLVSDPFLSVTSVSSVVSSSLPVPNAPVDIRVATLADLPFIDVMQKKQSRAVGFMPTQQLEGKIALGQILMATRDGATWGYLIGQDRYFNHDDSRRDLCDQRLADGAALARGGYVVEGAIRSVGLWV